MNDYLDKIMDFIPAYTAKHGVPPTLREIGKHIGVDSVSQVTYYRNRLRDLGWIEFEPYQHRTIRVVRRDA